MNRFDTKKVYFSKKLNRALEKIFSSRCTVINAPFGYGKTRSLSGFLEKNCAYYSWIDCTSSKDVFWGKYCDAISKKSDVIAEKIRKLGFPETSKKMAEFGNIMKVLPKDEDNRLLIVLDNYNLIEDETTNYLFLPDASYEDAPFSVVLITEGTLSRTIQDYTFNDMVYYINREEFIMEPEDIRDYMRGSSISIDMETANFLYQNSYGWMLVLNTYRKRYLKNGDWNIDVDIYNFIDVYFFRSLQQSVKELFVKLSIFDEFSVQLAEAVNNDGCNNLMDNINGFPYLILNNKNFTFSFHPIFRRFLMSHFELLATKDRNKVYSDAAEYYNSNGNYFNAIKLYYECGNYDKIFKIVPDFYDIYINVNNQNKKFFLLLADCFWAVERCENHRFSLMLAFVMFLYNEKDTMSLLCDQIETDVKEDRTLNDIRRQRYLAELEFVRSFLVFNNLDAMHEYYLRARSYSKLPITLIPNRYPYGFQLPSVLTIYFSDVGTLSELSVKMDDMARDYYLLTCGHGKGSSSLMKAEICYLNGNLKKAEIYCYNAIYEAESRNQYSIIIAAYMYLEKIALLRGNYEAFGAIRVSMESVYKAASMDNMEEYIKLEIDIVDAILAGLTGNSQKFPEWLKNSVAVEKSSNLIALCYVFNLHAKYLFITGNYNKILGIVGQMIGVTEVFSFLYIKLNAYILAAMAYTAVCDIQTAQSYFKEAVMMSYKDNIIMPFVENYDYIQSLLNNYNTTDREVNAFISSIKSSAKSAVAGLNKCKKYFNNQNNHGLTPREAEIAGLAAQRYSNRQIADQLFLAESTVKSAMKIIFHKLGISSRRELEEVL